MSEAQAAGTGQRSRSRLPLFGVGAGLALIGVVAVVVASTSRPHTDGPLASGDAGAIVNAFEAGTVVTYGMQTLGNDSPDATIELISVSVRMGDPAVELLGEPVLLGPERVSAMDAGVFDVLPGWPPVEDLASQPVRGAAIAAGQRLMYEVIVPLRVPDVDQGIGVIDGFIVEYEVDGRRYRDETNMVLVICPIEDYSACEAFDPNTDL